MVLVSSVFWYFSVVTYFLHKIYVYEHSHRCHSVSGGEMLVPSVIEAVTELCILPLACELVDEETSSFVQQYVRF